MADSAQLCKDSNAEFENLLLHTDVRWLTKGKCLKRVFLLQKEIGKANSYKKKDMN